MADISDKDVNLSQYKDSYGSFFMLHDTKAAIEAHRIFTKFLCASDDRSDCDSIY